jgi:type IV secretion system protein VirB2
MPFYPVGAVIPAPLRRKPDLTSSARGHRLRRLGEGPGLIGVLAAGLTLLSAKARAAGSGMPWEAPLQQILESVEGPVAKIIAVIIIIITGLALAFGETSGGSRKLIQIVFGLSIAFAASSFFLSFFSFGGGALI